MTKIELENKSLVLIILVAYSFNLLCGWAGFFCTHGSGAEILLYQLGAAFAISACVMAGRYTGLRGQHVAASAYILLGISHGISLAALGKTGINIEREVTMAMPMIPALIFMFWCNLYPLWVRVAGLLPSVCFALLYINAHLGDHTIGVLLYTGYATLQITEVIWGVYLYRDWQKNSAPKQG